MKVKLTDEDRCAIDLVLEHRGAGNGQLELCYTKNTGRSLKRRVDAVEKLFDVLEQSPAVEPRMDLAAATMQFIETNGNERAAGQAARQGRRVIAHAPEHRSLH